MTYERAVQELYFWQQGTGGGFQSSLFELFKKADVGNRRKLSMAFPMQAEALEDWESAGNCGNDLFRDHGLIKY